MDRRLLVWLVLAVACVAACGGSSPPRKAPPPASEETFGPLERGADYEGAGFRKVSDAPFRSLDHGNRMVEVYVTEASADAYLAGSEVPVGTIVVKTSVQSDGAAGPIFVMEKRAPGYAPDHADWWYAIHWADPPAVDAAKFGGPIYWRGASPRVGYCWRCHDDYSHSLGGLVPSSLLPR